MKLLDKVKKRLEENYEIDFLSEFWTDDQIVLLEDIVDATEKEVNNVNYTHCCKSDSEQLQAFKKDELVMLDGNLQVRIIIPEPKILISEDLGGAKMWVETHRCIKK